MCDPEKDATACGLVQSAAESAPEQMFRDPVTRTHRHRLRAAVTEAMEMTTTRDGIALDIGCGDGTLMSFLPSWIDAYGVDCVKPSDEVKDYGKAVEGRFPSENVLKKLQSYHGQREYDIITAISVLGAQDEPAEFLEGMKSALAADGIIVLETPYASLALMRNNVGVFNPDNRAVYTLSILEKLVRKAGLKIVRGAMTETEGGSLRLFLTHDDYTGHDYVPWLEQLARLWDEENALALTSRQTYQVFAQRIEANRQNVEGFFAELKKYGEHAHVIGVDPSMLRLLEWFGIDADSVSFIVSRDDTKHGTRIKIGGGDSEVEIVSEEDSRLALPDYFIASAALRREVLEHWREAIFEGAEVLFLTPEMDIVNENNYGMQLGKALAVTDGPGSVETLKSVLSTVTRPRLVAVNSAVEA
jgi:2-polyprenyl-3-methyl-5-hydroxy-6-metoxy-1,4-benzoquinol methylase